MAKSLFHDSDMDAYFFPYQPLDGEMETLKEDDFVGKIKLKAILGRVAAFKVYAQNGRISACEADRISDLAQNFSYAAKEALKIEQFKPDKLDWERVMRRLEGSSQGKTKKNTDQRTFFRIDGHKFLVPGLFTFGQRTVPEGLTHLVELTSSPMCAYKLSEVALLERKVVVKESKFEAADQMWYDRFVLQPHTRYQFEAGVTYVLVSPLKSLFSLHVLLKPDGAKFGEDPFEHRTLLDDPYAAMPSTPMPMAGPSKKRQREEEDDDFLFLMPTLPPQKRQREDDAFLLPPAKTTTVSKKRPRQEDEDCLLVEAPGPKIVKWSKGPYDYPDPEASSVWYKEIKTIDEIVEALRKRKVPVQEVPLNYCVRPEKPAPQPETAKKPDVAPRTEAESVTEPDIVLLEQPQNEMVLQERCISPQNRMVGEQYITSENQMVGQQYITSENQMVGQQYISSENQTTGEQYIPTPTDNDDLDSIDGLNDLDSIDDLDDKYYSKMLEDLVNKNIPNA